MKKPVLWALVVKGGDVCIELLPYKLCVYQTKAEAVAEAKKINDHHKSLGKKGSPWGIRKYEAVD